MLYSITLIKDIELSDTMSIITNSEQGWTIAHLNDYHSDVIFVRKSFEAEMASELTVMRYAEALHNMTFGQISLLEAEGDGITIFKNKETGDWEMRRSGKTFRYDMNYHLFEEVKEANNA